MHSPTAGPANRAGGRVPMGLMPRLVGKSGRGFAAGGRGVGYGGASRPCEQHGEPVWRDCPEGAVLLLTLLVQSGSLPLV